jgi:hypothetical protein
MSNKQWAGALPPGWRALFAEALAEMERLDPNVRILQAKEKYGTLRIYARWDNPVVGEVIEDASRRSACACEICGGDAVLTVRDHTFATLCDAHLGGAQKTGERPLIRLRDVVGRRRKASNDG